MISQKKFKRNKQIGKVMIILTFAIISTLTLDQFYIDSTQIRFLQWIFCVSSAFFAILEFVVPFAVLTPNHLIVKESVFFSKKYLLKNINKVSVIKGSCMVILTKDHRRHKVFLKGLLNSEKHNFVRILQRVAYNNNFVSGHHIHTDPK